MLLSLKVCSSGQPKQCRNPPKTALNTTDFRGRREYGKIIPWRSSGEFSGRFGPKAPHVCMRGALKFCLRKCSFELYSFLSLTFEPYI